jgi:acyl-CoA synthetase (AMP-forming)/AMP-acid ligase II
VNGIRPAAHDDPQPLRPHDDALIVFTSGTTSQPRAVVHSRASLAATLDVIHTLLPVAPGDRLMARDLHLIVPALRAGATVYLPQSQKPPAAQLLRAIEQQRITHVYEVTANLELLVSHLERERKEFPSSIRQVFVGAAPVRHAFFRRVAPLLPAGAEAWCVYGMTEMLPVAAIELRDKLAFTGDGDIVGRPVNGVTARIRDDGELVVGGPHLFDRYLGASRVDEHPTGDLACFEQGRIVLRGRSKDMIIRGEYNIYPALHEPIVERIEGVRRCAIVGLFDEEKADERILLVVEPESPLPSAAAEAAFRKQLRAAIEHGPHRIDDVALPDEIVIAAIPLSGRSSKVDKPALRRTLAARMNQ